MLSRLHRTIAAGAAASLIALTGTAASLAQSVSTVTLRTNGSCTAASPTIFDVRASLPKGATNDTGDNRDVWHFYLLDNDKTVLGRNSINVTIPYANPTQRGLSRQTRTLSLVCSRSCCVTKMLALI